MSRLIQQKIEDQESFPVVSIMPSEAIRLQGVNNVLKARTRQVPIILDAEGESISLAFNVMPGKSVSETLRVSQYRIWNRYAEAVFGRNYYSEMEHSPDHLIFISALVHFQKLTYIYMCYHLGLSMDTKAKELLKIWPIRIETRMPTLVRQKKSIVQTFELQSIKTLRPNALEVRAISNIHNRILIDATAVIFIKS